eukprot:gnl/TRDRNA2_/TRDRNA2_188759_c0_seq1.p1 gnl/TRDRNA2_/TRDRNA2_188759_c0~~gnl/TRDRNA2_/TRDRNA2_188759_c0_seq1.p1  ORF type:complete len:399 (+),score=63.74 gnl/TRDRNA2_/TRDRNA2_188759_c0_seq1:84-1280(+)
MQMLVEPLLLQDAAILGFTGRRRTSDHTCELRCLLACLGVAAVVSPVSFTSSSRLSDRADLNNVTLGEIGLGTSALSPHSSSTVSLRSRRPLRTPCIHQYAGQSGFGAASPAGHRRQQLDCHAKAVPPMRGNTPPLRDDEGPKDSISMAWNVPPPRDWNVFKEEFGLPKKMDELKQRLQTNLMHFTGNYAVIAFGLGSLLAFPDMAMCTCLSLASLSAIACSGGWLTWLDKWLRSSCNVSTELAVDVNTLKPMVNFIISPPPQPELVQEPGILVAEQVSNPQAPAVDKIVSIPQSSLVTALRSFSLVFLLFSSIKGQLAVLQSVALTFTMALVHAALKPPTFGSAFTRLVNADSQQDVDYAVDVMKKKAEEEVGNVKKKAEAEIKKFFNGLGQKPKQK